MSTLSEQLATLGIRPGEGGAIPSSVPDQIDEIMTANFPWGHNDDWHPTLVDVARDAHQTLEQWAKRLEFPLSRNGFKVVRTFESPEVASQMHYVIGTTGERRAIMEKCRHELIEVSEGVGVVYCRTCKLPVDAGWWLARHTKLIENAEYAGRALRKEAAELRAEIEKLKGERNKHRQAVTRAKVSKATAAIVEAVPSLRKPRRKKS